MFWSEASKPLGSIRPDDPLDNPLDDLPLIRAWTFLPHKKFSQENILDDFSMNFEKKKTLIWEIY